ncbi:hypothetical protein VP01_853g3 [Puccinia sorghi]|uniref:Uncharacterized protein n=1 Tax=Puccinia sorghi TaxID=27349 RepID=A0A0L6U921_9BASI|nr:hypothetical protein VP01_853g3 [Puccinia sorghi]
MSQKLPTETTLVYDDFIYLDTSKKNFFCCYSNLSPRIIQPSFDAHMLYFKFRQLSKFFFSVGYLNNNFEPSILRGKILITLSKGLKCKFKDFSMLGLNFQHKDAIQGNQLVGLQRGPNEKLSFCIKWLDDTLKLKQRMKNIRKRISMSEIKTSSSIIFHIIIKIIFHIINIFFMLLFYSRFKIELFSSSRTETTRTNKIISGPKGPFTRPKTKATSTHCLVRYKGTFYLASKSKPLSHYSVSFPLTCNSSSPLVISVFSLLFFSQFDSESTLTTHLLLSTFLYLFSLLFLWCLEDVDLVIHTLPVNRCSIIRYHTASPVFSLTPVYLFSFEIDSINIYPCTMPNLISKHMYMLRFSFHL